MFQDMLVKMESAGSGGSGYTFPFNFTNASGVNIKSSGFTCTIPYDSSKKYIFVNEWDNYSGDLGAISQYSVVEGGTVTDVYKDSNSKGTYTISISNNTLTATKQSTSTNMSYCMWIELSD